MKRIATLMLALLPFAAAAVARADSLRVERPSWPRFELAVTAGYAFGVHNTAPRAFVHNRTRGEVDVRIGYNPCRYVGVFVEGDFSGADSRGPELDPYGLPYDYSDCYRVFSMRGSVGIAGHLPLGEYFNLHGRVGYGFATPIVGATSYADYTPLDKRVESVAWPMWHYSGVRTQTILTTALTMEWCFNPNLGLLLEAGYRWPLKPANITLTHMMPYHADAITWRTRSWNRQVFITIGVLIK